MNDCRFVPVDLDAADWAQLEPLYRALSEREAETADALRAWLQDFSDLCAAVAEYAARKQIDQACHTDDAEIEKAYLHYVEQIAPKLKPWFFKLQKKYMAHPQRSRLSDEGFAVLAREWQTDIDLYRDENVPLETQVTKLVSEYDKLNGAMVVEFGGKSYTLQQLARFLEEPVRQTREAAWRLSVNRRLEDRSRIDELFEKLVGLRQEIGANAGFGDYREYAWRSKYRFDYRPEDCLAFAEAIGKLCVPIVEELDRKRQAELKVEALRPWDGAVDPKNRPPLRPFGENEPQELVEKVTEVFRRISPGLAGDFAELKFGRNLDLESRKGKRAGGFQQSLEQSNEPFIFMNAAGLQRDVETLLHEGGHAFHFIWAAREQPLIFLKHAPLEFCEVASMSMELIASDQLEVFYTADEAARAKRTLLEGIVRFFPWMAIIDSFQHWIYTHRGHTAEERTAQWLALLERFQGRVVDWSGYEAARAAMWHRQLHLFHSPFYYIEYGIAQLGALQLWLEYREDPQAALGHYREALKLGGTRPLPRLFEAAGLKFEFREETLGPLLGAVAEELRGLPD